MRESMITKMNSQIMDGIMDLAMMVDLFARMKGNDTMYGWFMVRLAGFLGAQHFLLLLLAFILCGRPNGHFIQQNGHKRGVFPPLQFHSAKNGQNHIFVQIRRIPSPKSLKSFRSQERELVQSHSCRIEGPESVLNGYSSSFK